MPWRSPRPQPTWGDIERLRWTQEQYDRPVFGSFSWTPPNVAANSSVAFVVGAAGPDVVSTVTEGLRAGSPVAASPPAPLPGQVSLYALCAATDTATIVIVNPTAGIVTPPAGTWSLQGSG